MMNNKKQNKSYSTREILIKHGFKNSKSMGQNFLIDPNIPEKIIKRSGLDKSCLVLEIGPGIGALTMQLCEAVDRVIAVEMDDRLLPILQDLFTDRTNISIIHGDILKMNIKKLIKSDKNEVSNTVISNVHVCANLPYNITTPAITTLIKTNIFKSITVMIQKEVAQRICAKPGSAEYGSFTVFTNYHTNPEILFDVPPECFSPRPKVNSAVIKMVIKDRLLKEDKEEEKFFRVVRAAFGQRRKTLANALYAAFKKTHSKEELSSIISDCGYDVKVRGEVLGIDDFIKLSLLL